MATLTGVILPSIGHTQYADGQRLAIRKIHEHYMQMGDIADALVKVESYNAPEDFKQGFRDVLEGMAELLSDLEQPEEPKVATKAKRWHCGRGHVFLYGNEDWHLEAGQGLDEDGYPIPAYCAADESNGEPCMDSSSLYSDF